MHEDNNIIMASSDSFVPSNSQTPMVRKIFINGYSIFLVFAHEEVMNDGYKQSPGNPSFPNK